MLHSHENTINFASCSFSFFMHTWISLWVCALILIIISQEVKNLRRRFIVTCKREKINVCNIISILHPESLRFLKNISLTHRMLNMIIAFFCVGIFFERVRKFFNSIRQVDKEHNKRWGAIARSDFFLQTSLTQWSAYLSCAFHENNKRKNYYCYCLGDKNFFLVKKMLQRNVF